MQLYHMIPILLTEYSHVFKSNNDDSNDDQETNTNEANGNNLSNEDNEEEDIGPILPGGHRLDKKFYCIKYPGKVINSDKAIESLGGLGSISSTINTPNRRLELRFRPSDAYCKPACGDRHEVSGFLLRIRVKKSRIKKAKESEKEQEVRNYRNLSPAMIRDSSKQDAIDNENSYRNEIKNLSKELRNCEIDAEQNANKTDDNNDNNESSNDQSSVSPSKNIPLKINYNKYEDLSEDNDYELPKLKILGRVVMEFCFTSLIDFQYTPVTQSLTDPKKRECIYDLICPKGIITPEWLDNKVPYFLPPAVFSRMDNVQQYNMKSDLIKDAESENIANKTRKRRAGFAHSIQFTSPTIPTTPKPGIDVAMKVKYLTNDDYKYIHSLFEERPIWSKTALLSKTEYNKDQLRILLPKVAYYFTTGPWRIMWVRLGYDPRKEPSARIYQTLDYRLKAMHGLEQAVKGKKTCSNFMIPYKSASAAKALKTTSAKVPEVRHKSKANQYSENDYIYKEGIIPPSRQTLYQYCDVLTNEVQEMFAKLPDPMPGVKCDEKRGWLPPGFSEHCREIMNKQVLVVLRKKMNIPTNYPTTLPRKRRIPSTLKLMKAKNVKKRKLLEKKKKELLKKKEENEKSG
ncbi:general transcription factor 3C polypeptide 5 isoform X2 [Microplitis demolitor]|nr:general transcription factor 3C polypeptide 5 isoform X2 [Microplitis demolitor]